MLVGHRQAWSWQDEWHGLTIEDIRQLEKQAQLELSKRIGELSGELMETSAINDQISAENSAVELIPALKCDDNKIEFLQGHYLTSEEQQLGIHMKHIEQSESDDEFDEDAFFDALGKLKGLYIISPKYLSY